MITLKQWVFRNLYFWVDLSETQCHVTQITPSMLSLNYFIFTLIKYLLFDSFSSKITHEVISCLQMLRLLFEKLRLLKKFIANFILEKTKLLVKKTKPWYKRRSFDEKDTALAKLHDQKHSFEEKAQLLEEKHSFS